MNYRKDHRYVYFCSDPTGDYWFMRYRIYYSDHNCSLWSDFKTEKEANNFIKELNKCSSSS